MDAISQIVGVLMILSSPGVAASGARQAIDEGELSISANPTKAVWSIEESPTLRVTLTNTGHKALWLPTRTSFGVSEPDEFDSYQAWVVATDRRNKEITSDCHLDYAPGRPPYRLLEPGASVLVNYQLHCFEFGPGQYMVRVYYWDRDSRAPQTPGSAVRLMKKSSSPPVPIKFVKSPRGAAE